MRGDEISTITAGSFQEAVPCPEELHLLVRGEDEWAGLLVRRDTQEEKPAQDGKCPVCGKEELIPADDYICYICRQQQCPTCGGSKLIGGGANKAALFREIISPLNNDLLAKEAAALHALLPAFEAQGKQAFLPHFVETRHVDGKRTNIFLDDGWDLYSLEEIREGYPEGIDPKDMAWMFRRLLLVLGIANDAGYAHGAILPRNVFIEPEAHGMVLANWAHSVKRPGRITSIVGEYRTWYPPEVFARNNVLAGTDIFMAAKCMEWVMGDQEVPNEMSHFLLGCMNPDAARRPNSAKEVFKQFNALLERVWGERTFHPFTMKER